jgi:hypothetical protein
MTETDTDPHLRVSRAARRLGRLFKIECGGGFDRRPVATIWRIIERRSALIEELQQLDNLHRSLSPLHSPELEQALRELIRDVNQAAKRAHGRVEQIGEDLRGRRCEGLSTGIRGGADCRLLGRS